VPGQFVKPFLKGQKNDFRDAEAVAEAVQRPTMRFVPTKSVDQLDLQALHRVRARLVSQRTATVNQIRAFLLERGIAVRQGLRFLRHALPDILANRADALTPRLVHMIEGLATDLHHLDERIEELTAEIEALAGSDEACRRLMTIPGIGPIIASAMVATIGDGSAFHRGRDFGAWLGLVPRQISTGDRTILGRISKRGNSYLRTLFVQAARVVLLRPANWSKHSFGQWLEAAAKRMHHNVVAAALANKLTRIAWSVLYHGRNYEPRTSAELA
jgi:transposase